MTAYIKSKRRRYYLCYRLRQLGVAIDAQNRAIQLNPDDLLLLPGSANKYVSALRDQHGFVAQTYIPCERVAAAPLPEKP